MNNLTTLRPITLERARKHRGEQRALNGFIQNIPFINRVDRPGEGGVLPGTTRVLVSGRIDHTFSTKDFCNFFSGITNRLFEVSIRISENNQEIVDGFNPLKDTTTPFIVGDNKNVFVNLYEKEFESRKYYIKVIGVNKGTFARSIDVIVGIKVYPNE